MPNELRTPYEIEMECEKAQTDCGIFVIARPQNPIDIQRGVIPRLMRGGRALQHRGEQSCGMAIHGTNRVIEERRLGTIDQSLGLLNYDGYTGTAYAAGMHTRWTTFGADNMENIHPIPVTLDGYRIAHFMTNGNTPAARKLQRYIPYQLSDQANDTMHMAHAMAHGPGETLTDRVHWLTQIPEVQNSAFCAVAMSGDTLVATSDRFGVHPLILGEIPDEGGPIHVLASEDSAIRKNGGHAIRALNPGETIRIDKNGVTVVDDGKALALPAHCIFERLYFMNANSHDIMPGMTEKEWRTIAYKRYRLGELMAEDIQEELKELDFLTDAPDSGRWFTSGLLNGPTRVRYLPIIQRILNSRSFTQGADRLTTEEKVRLKLDFLEEAAWIEGARIGIGDDSLIQGNTSRKIIEILLAMGAKNITFFLSMPPVVDKCHLGVNLKEYDKMIAYLCDNDPELIAQAIGAVRVRYSSHQNVIKAIQNTDDIVIPHSYNGKNPSHLYRANGLCPGCVTGEHIVDEHGRLNDYHLQMYESPNGVHIPLIAAQN